MNCDSKLNICTTHVRMEQVRASTRRRACAITHSHATQTRIRARLIEDSEDSRLYEKNTVSLCILTQPKEPYGFTITQAVTESCRNDMSNSQQIITPGLDTLHRRQLRTSDNHSPNGHPDLLSQVICTTRHAFTFQFSVSTRTKESRM